MKKPIALLLAILMLLVMVSCNTPQTENPNVGGSNGGGDNGSPNPNDAITTEEGVQEPKPICTEHSYENNVCTVCNCSLWSGASDTSWYSVVESALAIQTADQFAGFIELVNGGTSFEETTVTLANNIDMNQKPIAPIGDENHTFAGTLNGNHYTISDMLINDESVQAESDVSYIGLFGYSKGKISNLHVKNLTVDLKENPEKDIWVGGLIAYNEGDVENCSIHGSIDINGSFGGIGDSRIGGLIAYSKRGITHCASDISIFVSCGSDMYLTVAGLVGYASNGIAVTECSSQGSIAVESEKYVKLVIGGLAGQTGDRIKITNCYSTIDIEANIKQNTSSSCHAGGLIGNLSNDIQGVSGCYSTGNVSLDCTGYGYASGLIGNNVGGTALIISDCFAAGNVICKAEGSNGSCSSTFDAVFYSKVAKNCYYFGNQTLVGDKIVKNGTPASLDDFKNIVFYQNKMQWDTNVWNIVDGELPTLK